MDMFENFAEQMNNALFGQINDNMKQTIQKQQEIKFTPKRILKSGNTTIVFWTDGTKTVVRCPENEIPDDYEAFTAALAIKVFGSNSHLKKTIKRLTVIQQLKKGKE